MKKITLVNPPLVFSRKDVFTTGIVYMPAGLAYFAAALEKKGFEVSVVDAFGEDPDCLSVDGDFAARGLCAPDAAGGIDPGSAVIFVYAGVLSSHRASLGMIKACKAALPLVPVIAMENTQAATAYSLEPVAGQFYDAGADFILTGEPEERGIKLIEAVISGQTEPAIDGVGFRKNGRVVYAKPDSCIQDLDLLPFPSWELFPVKNYWKLNYAHGPLKSGRYLPVITSRGCPYSCNFCVAPATNSSRWRKRSARRVADELSYLKERFDVSEFHVEDLNPTVDDARTRELCGELISRSLNVEWKLCAGTKVETIKDEGTVELMAQAGCRYISVSPESGSASLMKAMNKTFDLDHALKIVRKAKQCGIFLQACFVLGYPGETGADRRQTSALAKTLVKAGVDEIAVFIITPVPGSKLFGEITGFGDISELNFSPAWRKDFGELARYRLGLYRDFLLWKLLFHPFRLLKQPLSFVRGSFDTKMEMAPYRALHTLFLLLFAKRCKK